jgi:hypothetical protein
MFHHVRATPARGCQTQFGGLTVQSRVPTPARNSTWASIFTWIPPNLFYPPSPTSVAALLMSLRIHPPGHCRARPRRSPPPPFSISNYDWAVRFVPEGGAGASPRSRDQEPRRRGEGVLRLQVPSGRKRRRMVATASSSSSSGTNQTKMMVTRRANGAERMRDGRGRVPPAPPALSTTCGRARRDLHHAPPSVCPHP